MNDVALLFKIHQHSSSYPDVEVKQGLYKAWEALHHTHTHTHTPPPSFFWPQSSFMPSGLLCPSHTSFLLILEHVRSSVASMPWHWMSCPCSQTSIRLNPSPAASLYPSDTSQWGLPWASYVEVHPPFIHFQSLFLLYFSHYHEHSMEFTNLFYITHYKACFVRAEIIICFTQC